MQCLSDMKDDLSSSVGAVMDLLGRWIYFSWERLYIYAYSGKLVVYDKVIALLGSDSFG